MGHEFIIFKRASAVSTDIQEIENVKRNLFKYQEKERIGSGHKFILHPHQLVLAATIEYISLPSNLAAYITGRSTWGRTGRIIATATQIAPGFKGCVTLELVNEGEIPLVIYPGLCVAQIVFTTTEGKAKYTGQYKCPTGPEFPKLDKEVESLPLSMRPLS